MLPSDTTKEATVVEKKAEPRKVQALRPPSFGDDFSSAKPGALSPSGSALPAGPQDPTLTPKEQTLATLHDAMVTYSSEGVPTIQPYLSNPDPEIRANAIESMKQLGVPEAAAALRAAAGSAKDPNIKRALEDAAEFVDMPSLFAPAGN